MMCTPRGSERTRTSQVYRAADKWTERKEAGGLLGLRWLIGSRAGMLITYLGFQSTERFFSGAGEGGRERRPDASDQ